ncbi:hypothetical protein ADUPG1_007121, partial [Aduncisulcus paluster]
MASTKEHPMIFGALGNFLRLDMDFGEAVFPTVCKRLSTWRDDIEDAKPAKDSPLMLAWCWFLSSLAEGADFRF